MKRYEKWAKKEGLLTGELPELAELQALLKKTMPSDEPPHQVSSVEPYREGVTKMVEEGVETKASRDEPAVQASYQECG